MRTQIRRRIPRDKASDPFPTRRSIPPRHPRRHGPPEHRVAMPLHTRQHLGRPAARNGPRREPPMLQQPVIQHDRPRNRQVQREPRRDTHHMTAPRPHRLRQPRPLRPQHIRCVQRMPERRQVHRIVQQLDPHHHAFPRQYHRPHIRKSPQWHACGRVAGISAARRPRVPPRLHRETERRPERMRRPQQRPHVRRLADALRAQPEIPA